MCITKNQNAAIKKHSQCNQGDETAPTLSSFTPGGPHAGFRLASEAVRNGPGAGGWRDLLAQAPF